MNAIAGIPALPLSSDKPWYPSAATRLGATFYVRQAFPWLHRYFDLPQLRSTLSPGIDGIVSWGDRIPAKTAKAISGVRGLPHWSLEDGFLRSVGLGKEGSVPFSITADDIGKAVDASRPSRLETLIVSAGNRECDGLGARIREAIVDNRLSKYNHLPHRPPSIERSVKRRILLVDQVVGDMSVGGACGSSSSFDRMLRDALQTDAQCIVRTHPDVMAGLRKGYLTDAASRRRNVVLAGDTVSVSAVLDVVDEVWTVSSQFGFDALLRGKPVRCYAAPFYAGWGLTQDFLSRAAQAAIAQRRTEKRTVDQIAAAAFSLYPSYRDPSNWQPIDVFRAIELIVATQRQDGLI
ncbi:capsular polysaccharide export protein [Rhizobium sp. BK376]|nr:capsular polysaccharide export protein [Rhizobium sp. BK376]